MANSYEPGSQMVFGEIPKYRISDIMEYSPDIDNTLHYPFINLPELLSGNWDGYSVPNNNKPPTLWQFKLYDFNIISPTQISMQGDGYSHFDNTKLYFKLYLTLIHVNDKVYFEMIKTYEDTSTHTIMYKGSLVDKVMIGTYPNGTIQLSKE
jgi:hypothetical protein